MKIKKEKSEKPRLSRRARLIIASVFNLFCIAVFALIGIYGFISEAVPGAVMCMCLSALFVVFYIFAVKLIKTDKKILANGKNKALRVISAVMAWFILVNLIISLGATAIVYELIFNNSYTTYEPYSLSVEDFDGLKVENCKFESNNGQMLAGYRYYKDSIASPKGLLIIAHGHGGGGQNTYMPIADYFTTAGYKVFAYDATANDNSEGDSLGGLPQGLIDLDYAIRYVEADEEYKELPIVLFGHSWGGYCVTNVLSFHPEVKAVVSAAGFNRSSCMLQSYAERYAGFAATLTMPFVNSYEFIKFGLTANSSAMKAFEASDAGVFIIHSKDDKTVGIDYGYNIYYEKYKDDDRFTFVEYEDRGHGQIYYSDAVREYTTEINEQFDEYFGYVDKVDPDEKAEYLHEHLDKSKMYELDTKLFSDILEFYDSYITK